MLKKYRKPLLAAGILALAALLMLAFLGIDRNPPAPPLPVPNGYDDFLKASVVMSGDLMSDTSGFDRAAVQALVSTNAEALRLVRLGLTRNCSVHTESA